MAAETTVVSGLAERYATALFELAESAGTLDSVEADLKAVETMLAESADLVRLVRSPVISRREQAAAMDALAERAGFSPLTRKFLGLLAHKRRLFALLPIIKAFRTRLAAHRGEISAQVFTATALKPAQKTAIEEALKAVAGRTVSVDAKVDPGLLGGLVVKMGSKLVDGSLRTKLRHLERAMKGVG